ncbi:hypothetical protein IW140_005547 [Coemansia sp. RSA 1813]|nr:hypothetical protein EV178_005538 [Coemansia sp. RSA 1646]KAJ1766070.1 hypothetical protein LPJ74_006063 [Coemansia sp. RSA 1843]KAJ2086789.1 hypothetical protein IW138_005415 [Coemansia sp. RSA 986]KAJ2211393.1 hypothetical protein EV179_005531 [Coemansia sp. RSA 487]KAJ2564964.1 hypothetical protein IW140_005547 [Coemansia sp. RSA 1813]
MLRLVHSISRLGITSQRIRTLNTTPLVTKAAAALATGGTKPERTATKTAASKTKKKTAKKTAKAAKPKKKKKAKVLSAEEQMLKSKTPLVAYPKGPIRSGYLQFYKEQFSSASADVGIGGVEGVAREMSLKWKRLDEDEKAKYVTLVQAQRAQYEKEVLDWWKSVDHKMVFLENKRRRRINKRIREKAKAGEPFRGSKLPILKDPFHPKRPLSAYMRFVKTKLTRFDPSGGVTLAQRAQQLGTQWKSMSAGEKAPFVEAANTDLVAYKKALEKYVSSISH